MVVLEEVGEVHPVVQFLEPQFLEAQAIEAQGLGCLEIMEAHTNKSKLPLL